MNTNKKNQPSHAITQLKQWKSKFGDDYTDRNVFEDWKLEPGQKAFKRMLGNLDIGSILEIGSNIGLNLIYLTSLMKSSVDLYAVEPNQTAYSALTSDTRIRLKQAWNTSVFNIPLPDSVIDLVFTSGVLIHIAPKDLGNATDEIIRVAKRYVLCIEYFSHKPESISYQGQDNLLFKRDFGFYYLDRYSELNCIDYGFLWQREFKIFDNLNWWLFEKIKL